MKVIVIGAGIMGLASAWACRRRRMDVTVYEQHRVPNPLGTSVDDHRQMFRASYDNDPLCLLNDSACRAWEVLWHDLGENHFRRNGTLLLARNDLDLAAASQASLRRLGFAFEKIPAADLARRYPHLELSGVRFGVLEPEGGTLFARRIVEALLRHLRSTGVRVVEESPVESVDAARGVVSVAGRVEHGDCLVVAAGPWLPGLFPATAKRMTPSRRIVLYLDAPPRLRHHWQSSPDVVTGMSGIYFVPPGAGTGLKAGFHRDATSGHPDDPRTVDDDEAAAALRRAAGALTAGDDYRVELARSCFYDMSADERAIVERQERAWILTGFSGHGFSLGALAGIKVAQAIAGELPGETLTRLFRGDDVPAPARAVS